MTHNSDIVLDLIKGMMLDITHKLTTSQIKIFLC